MVNNKFNKVFYRYIPYTYCKDNANFSHFKKNP